MLSRVLLDTLKNEPLLYLGHPVNEAYTANMKPRQSGWVTCRYIQYLPRIFHVGHRTCVTVAHEMEDTSQRTRTAGCEPEDANRRMGTAGHKPQDINRRMQTVGCELQDVNRRTRTAGRELQDTNCSTQTAGCEPQDTNRRTQTA